MTGPKREYPQFKFDSFNLENGLDAALRLIDNNSSPVRITQAKGAVRLFRFGYLSRFILSTLRVRGPMDREALTLALMIDAGLDMNDPLLLSEVSRRVR
jgi:hypothetical protein